MIEIVTKERIPETFDELKELCKDFCEFREGKKGKFVLVKIKDNCFWFSSYGTIEIPGLQYVFAKGLNPPQMWGIIVNLRRNYENIYKKCKAK